MNRERGFTLLELVVVVAVIGILGALLLDRTQRYQELAEKTAMEQTVGIVRSALHLQVANLIAYDRMAEIPKLARQNPMDWLAEKPGNYVGERSAPKSGEVPAGSWYYDTADKTLVYVVDRGAHFNAANDGRKWVRYQLRTVSSILAKEAPLPADRSMTDGVVLEPIRAYEWL